MVYALPSIYLRERDAQTPMEFWHTNGSTNLSQSTRLYNNQQKKRTCRIVDFTVLGDHWVKLKENIKKDKYLDLARKLKNWNMKVTFIPVVTCTHGTVTEGLIKGLEDLEIRGRVETIQTITLLRTATILRKVVETWEDLLSLKLLWKIISSRWCKNLSRENNNNKNNKK